jgi:hypothetical protein
MNANGSIQISGKNLSIAWAKAFLKCFDTPGGVLRQAVVHFREPNQMDEIETPLIRTIVDSNLREPRNHLAKHSVVESVAGTIFPESIWRRSGGCRNTFFDMYTRLIPFIRKCPLNRRGLYFQRLMAYQGFEDKPINQLRHIIETWLAGNHRLSALQAGIFDPRTDHSNSQQMGFPCLQQVVFQPNGVNGTSGLSVTAFYANQTLVEKAYGNYLGLRRLGKFMAKEMGLALKEVICVSSALKLSAKAGKADCEALRDQICEGLKYAGE